MITGAGLRMIRSNEWGFARPLIEHVTSLIHLVEYIGVSPDPLLFMGHGLVS